MDEPKSVEMELDWDAIEFQVKLYDGGDRNPLSLRAKMLERAFNDGFAHCTRLHVEAANSINLMFIQPEGNA
jgi:hypothetical protein